MSKYIIKNCPARYRGYRSDYECCSKIDPCEEVTDCPIKQIVEICKDIDGYSDIDLGRRGIAMDILDLLEIQKVED